MKTEAKTERERLTEEVPAQGRLVMVIEKELSEASRLKLRDLLEDARWREEVTMVSGLSRASMLQAEAVGDGVFYNRREYLSPEQAFALLPWREIWVVAAGRVWQLAPDGRS